MIEFNYSEKHDLNGEHYSVWIASIEGVAHFGVAFVGNDWPPEPGALLGVFAHTTQRDAIHAGRMLISAAARVPAVSLRGAFDREFGITLH